MFLLKRIISSKVEPEREPEINWNTLTTSDEDYKKLEKHKYNINWAEFAKNPNSIKLYLRLTKDLKTSTNNP
jgi:hypothetical protein